MQSIMPTDAMPALEDLLDALARTRAQARVVRLAAQGMYDERDLRAVIAAIVAIEDELQEAERLVRL